MGVIRFFTTMSKLVRCCLIALKLVVTILTFGSSLGTLTMTFVSDEPLLIEQGEFVGTTAGSKDEVEALQKVDLRA